jgi:hypothetical protein
MPIVIDTTPGVQVGLVLNPTSDGFPTELNIGDGLTYAPKAAAFPPPTPRPAYASSYDTEGSIASDEAHYDNREITIAMWVSGGGAPDVEEALNDLAKMVGQVNREGGVLKFTTPNGTVCYFDLVQEASAELTVDHLYLWKNLAEVQLRLVARPFWRGVEVDLGSTSETSLPWLILAEAGQAGDVPSLGRVVVTSPDRDMWTVIIGGQSRYYSADATAALGYQAEDLTPVGTSTKTAGATGASGSGSNVVRNTNLTSTYQAILRSEIDATNAALTHKGTYRVWAKLYRPTGNTGAVSVRLEWAEGDYTRPTLNDPVGYAADDREGVFTWVNLGIVSIDPTSTRWEFRLLAKSTIAGDEIDADCFLLVPTEVVYTELSGKAQFQWPSSFSALSTFDTESGAITGDSATVGGAWAGAGDADDFSAGSSVATRTAVSDAADTGRYAISGAAAFAAQLVQVDLKVGTASGVLTEGEFGVLARYVDTSNFLRAAVRNTGASTPQLEVVRIEKRVAGTFTILADVLISPLALSTFYTLSLLVDAAGRWTVWLNAQGLGVGEPIAAGYDAVLATGGALDDGKPGMYDEWGSAAACTRTYDNFAAWAPANNAAIFAGQSLTLAHDGATRKDATGTVPSTVPLRSGRYLKIPPAGPEGRSTRLAILALPNDPYTMGDVAAIYDLSAQLYVTPRGLVVPEA